MRSSVFREHSAGYVELSLLIFRLALRTCRERERESEAPTVDSVGDSIKAVPIVSFRIERFLVETFYPSMIQPVS